MSTTTEQDLPEIVISSRTQSEEFINKHLESLGYRVQTTTIDDSIAVPVESEPQVEESTEGAPPAEEQVAEEVVTEPEAVPEPVAPPPPAEHKSKPGSAKLKEKLEKTRLELEETRRFQAELKAELEALKNRPVEVKVEVPKPPEPEAPKFELPKKPEFKMPTLDDPEVGGDFDKLQVGIAQAQVKFLEDTLAWNSEVDKVKKQEERYNKERQDKQNNDVQEAQQQDINNKWNAILEKGKTKYDNFQEEVYKTHTKMIKNNAMSEALLHLDNSEDLIYWISTHPDEANKLAEETLLPNEKNSKVTATADDWNKSLRKVYVAFGKIAASIVDPAPKVVDPPAPEEEDYEEDDQAPEPVAVAPRVVAPKAAPVVPKAEAPKPKPKPTPPSTVGGRNSGGYRRLKEMTPEEIQALHPDEYRERYQKGEMR